MNSTCRACVPGNWDVHCTRPCDLRCSPTAGCDKVTGACLGCAARNATGVACELQCPTSCLGGVCSVAAAGGFNCTNGCEPGYYGVACNRFCSSGCSDAGCDRETGVCSACRPTYYDSPTCRLRCATGCLVPVNSTAPVCAANASGSGSSCAFGCKPRNYPLASNCSLSCPSGCADAPANASTTNVCEGDSAASVVCRFGCRVDMWGQSSACSARCPSACVYGNGTTSSCDASTGDCTFGCDAGYWGKQCEKSCPYRCFQGACNRDTGTCLQCSSTTGGANCTVQCSNCDREQGVCDDNGCTKCKPGFYGPTCQSSCSQCQGDCNIKTGLCTAGCVSGRYGDRCQFSCPQTCLGDDPQGYEGLCEQFTGNCVLGCKSGNTGPQCSTSCRWCMGSCNQAGCEKCFPGRWGTACENSCSSCENERCSSTGRCEGDCRDGQWGERCNMTATSCLVANRETGVCTECQANRWGSQCANTCPTWCASSEQPSEMPRTCDGKTGFCLFGCIGEKKGDKCEEDDNTTEIVSLVAGLTPVFVFCCVIISVVTCQAVKTARGRRKKADEVETGPDGVAMPATTVYSNKGKFYEHEKPFKAEPDTPM